MSDVVLFRHPSGAIFRTTERMAPEFLRQNPEWIQMDSTDIAEMERPGIRTLMELFSEVEVTGLEGRNIEADYDRLRIAMHRRVR